MPKDFTSPHVAIDARDPASKQVLLDGAIEGHVLVKNLNKTLPLKKPKVLSIFGYDAKAPPALDVGLPTASLSPFSLGYESQLLYVLSFASEAAPPPQIAPNGTWFTGGKWDTILPCESH